MIRYGRETAIPILVGVGEISPPEGLEGLRRLEDAEGSWEAWRKERTLLGASSEFPEGIYAKGGDEMVCMTEDEFRHWYGRCSHSSGSNKGA